MNAKSHGARPVHQIITMIKWIRINRLSIKNSPSQVLLALLGIIAAVMVVGFCYSGTQAPDTLDPKV